MVLVFQVLVDEVGQQLLEHVGGVLQAALQARHDERGHVAAVPHGEATLKLQGADEGQQEHLVVDELCEELQGLLHVLLPIALHLGGGGRAWPQRTGFPFSRELEGGVSADDDTCSRTLSMRPIATHPGEAGMAGL